MFSGRTTVKNKFRKNRYSVFVLYAVILSMIAVLGYAFCCFPFYIHQKSEAMYRIYDELQGMELADLDDEEIETINEYQEEKLEILIVDEKFDIEYSSRSALSSEFVRKHVSSRLDQYVENPEIDRRSYQMRQMLTLKGKITQKNQDYYIYIRKEVQSGLEIMEGTIWYLAVVLILLCAGESWLMKKYDYSSNDRSRQADFYLLERQREFIANVSHELKTPLAVVSSQVEMLEMMGDKVDREYYFSSIHEELDKMSTMIGELLDFTMLDNQLDSMKTGKTDVSELMEYLLMRYDAIFRKNSIRVERKITPECCVCGNQMYLERAVNNYLMNALQHTGQGRKIRVSVTEGKNMVRIEVYNEGELIEKDQMEHIWDSFYTFSRKQKSDNQAELKNVGLGLFVVRKITEKHRGSCGAENLSDGVRFWIELPAYEK